MPTYADVCCRFKVRRLEQQLQAQLLEYSLKELEGGGAGVAGVAGVSGVAGAAAEDVARALKAYEQARVLLYLLLYLLRALRAALLAAFTEGAHGGRRATWRQRCGSRRRSYGGQPRRKKRWNRHVLHYVLLYVLLYSLA